jgi:diguanylate cyclase (GGDEF)-like protein
MTPILDVRTMVLVYVGIRLGLALVLVYMWQAQDRSSAARDCALGALVSAAGLLLLALRDLVPVWVSEVLSNALILPGWMAFDFGIVRAADRRPPYKLGAAICALAVGCIAWFTLAAPDHRSAALTQNLVFVFFDLYAAWACLRVSEPSRALTFRLIGALLALLTTICLWRAADVAFDIAHLLPAISSRGVLIAASLLAFPMIALLFALQTSQGLLKQIGDQARRDMLTGAYNRRAFDELIKREWSRSVGLGHPLCVLTVDIDHFKIFNDEHGHQAGDMTLVHVSHTAQSALRSNDVWCRYGGEEFVALLPNATLGQAMIVAERVRSAVERSPVLATTGALKVTVSIGAAQRSPTDSDWASVLAASDAALYRAKDAGRNCVVGG